MSEFTNIPSLQKTKRIKDEAGFYCILPNEEYRQNDHVYFLMPKRYSKEVVPHSRGDVPVVLFKKLQHQTERKIKTGATLQDLMSFIFYLFEDRDLSSGRTKDNMADDTLEIRNACMIIREIEFQMTIQEPLAMTDSKLLNMVNLTENASELELLIQFGKTPYSGFLYGTLLTFANILVKKTRKGVTEISLEDAGKLNKVESALDRAIFSLRTKHTEISPCFDSFIYQDNYEKKQLVFPSVVLEYLIDKKVIPESARKNLSVYGQVVTKKGEVREKFNAQIEPNKNGRYEKMTCYRGKKQVAWVDFRNKDEAKLLGPAKLDLSVYDITTRIHSVTLQAPMEGFPHPVILTAKSKKGGPFHITTEGYRGTSFRLDENERVVKIKNGETPQLVGELKLSDSKVQVTQMEMIMTDKDKREPLIRVSGPIDKDQSVESQVFEGYINKVFRHRFFVTSESNYVLQGRPTLFLTKEAINDFATILTYKTRDIQVKIKEDETILKPIELSQIYVTDLTGKESKLLQLYHDYRASKKRPQRIIS